ncbi:MAG: BON domain-containing protein, partial [Methylocystis sp.]|nr:BON domain-containing protein [Methylocystis sp.]
MYQPKKWWIGLPLVAALFALAAAFDTETIEKDIGARVRSRLQEASQAIDNPQVAVNGRDVAVSGSALSESAKTEAIAIAGRQAGVRKISDATTVIPVVKPFVFVAERVGKRVTFSGNAPSASGRDKMKAAAAAIGAELADNAGFAGGAPQGFGEFAAFAIAQLARLDPGKIRLVDNALSISGQTKTSADYENALAAVEAPPDGAVVAALEISAPRVSPYVWSAARSGEKIALAGSIPSNDVRVGIAAKAAAIATTAAVSDETHVGSGAPPGDFAAAVAFALAELGKLTQGKVVLTDAKLTIEGAG